MYVMMRENHENKMIIMYNQNKGETSSVLWNFAWTEQWNTNMNRDRLNYNRQSTLTSILTADRKKIKKKLDQF